MAKRCAAIVLCGLLTWQCGGDDENSSTSDSGTGGISNSGGSQADASTGDASTDGSSTGGSGTGGSSTGGSGGTTDTGGASSGGSNQTGGTGGETSDAGSCGAIGSACTDECPDDLICDNGMCRPETTDTCGGFNPDNTCSPSAPVCLYCEGCDFGPCFTEADAKCICNTAGGRKNFVCP